MRQNVQENSGDGNSQAAVSRCLMGINAYATA
ncbi:hypothetical protein EM595_0003 [Duffyella gerundensis]|uniref:Uncharacterized protein n=1 Tax=Duffyella gerundensis TaxID=1619313 RepID=A0A0U5KZE2_9GAMM|nr:hypothetical protein EM595_0003 [Duffyella gerundensis]